MAALIFFLLMGALIVYGIVSLKSAIDRGEHNPWDAPTHPAGTGARTRVATRKDRGRAKPAEPVFDMSKLMENSSCEVCSSSPRVQFRKPETGAVLEFCGHHATRKESALLAKGFAITVDVRHG